jgi:hypothetical protein
MAHVVLEHTFDRVMFTGDDRKGCVNPGDPSQEAEAAELGAELLVPKEAALRAALYLPEISSEQLRRRACNGAGCAETIASVDVEVGEPVRVRDRFGSAVGGVWRWRAFADDDVRAGQGSRFDPWQRDRARQLQWVASPAAVGRGCLVVLFRLAYLGVTNALAMLRLLPTSDRAKDAEILALRHQITILERQLHGQRIRFTPSDRALLAALLHRLPAPCSARSGYWSVPKPSCAGTAT